MASLNWHLAVCGINHKNSTIGDREPLQINREDLAGANTIFGKLPDVRESVILSTCNRVEFYFVAFKKREPYEIIADFYRQFNACDIADLKDRFYIRKNKHAADHLFHVAAGIDSMVLGENQISGQIKEAYSSACAVRTAGKVIHRLFHQAFRVGKLVRTDTEMGKGFCSVSSAAIGLLKSKIEHVDKPTILFIGINQMISLAASGLAKSDYDELIFVNRTPEKAVAFAERFGGTGYGFDQLEKYLAEADVVITCTGSDRPIISKEVLNRLLAGDPRKRLFIMDLAAPRDVEADNQFHTNIDIFNQEDIKEYVRDQQTKREQAIPQAEVIIDRKMSEFNYWFDQVRQEPIYNGLGDAFESAYQHELGIILDKLEPDLRDEFDRAGKKLIKKLLSLKVGDNRNM